MHRSPQTAIEAARTTGAAGLFARVSSHDQKSGLDGQVARLSAWAAKAGLPVVWAEEARRPDGPTAATRH